MANRPRTVDPEFEVFWREVGEAVRAVRINNQREIAIERGTMHADVSWAEWSDDEEGVQIEVIDIEPKQPALIDPGSDN